MAKPLRTAEHLRIIDERLDRIEVKVDERFAQVDQRFEQVDKRFEQVDQRFEQVDKRFDQVDKRFDDQRSHFDALAEEGREQFRNLYDLLATHVQNTDSRFKRFETEMRNSVTDIQAAIQTFVGRAPRRRRKRVN